MFDVSKIEPISKEPFEFGPIQTKWLEALESGNYQQGNGYLKRNGRYCCLGVLCEIAGLKESIEEGGATCFSADELSSSSTYVPEAVVPAFGLRNPAGALHNEVAVEFNSALGTLASLNDHTSLSFAELAAYIRHDPHNVFTHAA